MCTVSPDKPESSACSDAPFSSPQLPVLIEQLQNVVANLHVLNESPVRSETTANSESNASVRNEECRYMRLPAEALQKERDTLELYEAEDFKDILFEAVSLLRALVSIIESLDTRMAITAATLDGLGKYVRYVANMLSRMEEAYDTVSFKPIAG